MHVHSVKGREGEGERERERERERESGEDKNFLFTFSWKSCLLFLPHSPLSVLLHGSFSLSLSLWACCCCSRWLSSSPLFPSSLACRQTRQFSLSEYVFLWKGKEGIRRTSKWNSGRQFSNKQGIWKKHCLRCFTMGLCCINVTNAGALHDSYPHHNITNSFPPVVPLCLCYPPSTLVENCFLLSNFLFLGTPRWGEEEAGKVRG